MNHDKARHEASARLLAMENSPPPLSPPMMCRLLRSSRSLGYKRSSTFATNAMESVRALLAPDVCIYGEVDLVGMSACITFDNSGSYDEGLADAWVQSFLSQPLLSYWHWMKPHQAIMPSDFGSSASFRALDFHEQCMHPMGIQHGILVPIEWDGRHMSIISCGRHATPFTNEDRIALNALAPHLESTRHAYHNLSRVRLGEPIVASDLSVTQVEFVALDHAGRLIEMSIGASSLIARHVGPFPRMKARLPEPLDSLVKLSRSIADWTRVEGPGDLEIIPVAEETGSFIYLLHRMQIPNHTLAKILGTTVRRAEVARLHCQGIDRQQVAHLLSGPRTLAVRTIDKHMYEVRRALGVRNNSELVAEVRRRVEIHVRTHSNGVE